MTKTKHEYFYNIKKGYVVINLFNFLNIDFCENLAKKARRIFL